MTSDVSYMRPAPRVVNAVADWLKKHGMVIWGPCCFCMDIAVTGKKWASDQPKKVKSCEDEKRIHCEPHHNKICANTWGSW